VRPSSLNLVSLVAIGLLTLTISACSSKTSESTQTPEKLQNLKSADGRAAHVLQGPEFDNVLVSAKEFQGVGGGDYVVNGNKSFDGWFLKADRVIFEPGSTLMFSKTALSNRRQFWIVTKELIVKDAEHPGTITYDKGAPAPAPPAPGEAPGGTHAQGDGSAGGPGQQGGKGNQGATGANGPQITLVVMQAPNSGTLVDLTGGDGGPGGQGQKGGRGGNGAKGSPASQSAVDCKSGGGNGGAGGAGGVGGPGGDGGTGGAGGIFLLVSKGEHLPSLTQKFRVKTSGGNGGNGGPSGVGGDYGLGGPGGQEAKPYCSGGNGGPNGTQGGAGGPGSNGANGQEGDFTVGAATDDQFNTYFWPKTNK